MATGGRGHHGASSGTAGRAVRFGFPSGWEAGFRAARRRTGSGASGPGQGRQAAPQWGHGSADVGRAHRGQVALTPAV